LGVQYHVLMRVCVALRADVHPVEIGKFIMNDIGPFVPATGLHRLGTYVGKESKFRYRGSSPNSSPPLAFSPGTVFIRGCHSSCHPRRWEVSGADRWTTSAPT